MLNAKYSIEGYFSLLAASRGYEVTGFEAMEKNFLIQRVSLCANPELDKLVTLKNQGLGETRQTCFIVSADSNLADGILRCDLKSASNFKQKGYQIRDQVQLETMDAVVEGDYFMMKIDIEGAEPLALSVKGTSKFFSKHSIQYLLTEATTLHTRLAYFERLSLIGYNLRTVDYNRGPGNLYNVPLLPNPFSALGHRVITSPKLSVDYFGDLQHSRLEATRKSPWIKFRNGNGQADPQALRVMLFKAQWPTSSLRRICMEHIYELYKTGISLGSLKWSTIEGSDESSAKAKKSRYMLVPAATNGIDAENLEGGGIAKHPLVTSISICANSLDGTEDATGLAAATAPEVDAYYR